MLDERLGTWITVAEAAAMMGLSRRQARRRLRRLDHAVGGMLLLRVSRTGNLGNYLVNADLLLAEIRRARTDTTTEIVQLRECQAETSARLDALAARHHQLVRRVRALESR